MDNFWYLFAAYSLIWIGLFVYIFTLVGREKQLLVEVEELKNTLDRMEARGGA